MTEKKRIGLTVFVIMTASFAVIYDKIILSRQSVIVLLL